MTFDLGHPVLDLDGAKVQRAPFFAASIPPLLYVHQLTLYFSMIRAKLDSVFG